MEIRKELALYKADDIERELTERFGGERAQEITARWDLLSRQADESDNPGRQDALYEYLNSDYELSLAVSRYTDADIISGFESWLSEHKSLFGKRILDVGCGTGILSCILAEMLPDSHITAIDRSENCIGIADMIKEKLGLDNIDFIPVAAEDIKASGGLMPEGGFDTVLSVRTFHENIEKRYTGYMFEDFSRQLEIYEEIYAGYLKSLCSLLEQGATLVCLERNHPDTELLSIFNVLGGEGLCIIPESVSEIFCNESDFKELSSFTSFAAVKKSEKQSREDIFSLWKEKAFNHTGDENEFTRAQADWYMENNAGELIDGYASYDVNGNQLAKNCLYMKKDDEGSVILYQANYKDAGIRIIPAEHGDDVRSSMSDHRFIDMAMGFQVKGLL